MQTCEEEWRLNTTLYGASVLALAEPDPVIHSLSSIHVTAARKHNLFDLSSPFET